MNNKQHTASHRCQQLLQHNKDNLPVFIRYGWRYDFCWSLKSEKQGWHLYSIETDDETWREYPHYIATITYEWGQRTNSFEWTMEWLKQPAEGE